jgi:hypothetical protein
VNICFSRGVGDLWNDPLQQPADKCIFMLSMLMSSRISGQSGGNFVTVCYGPVCAVFGPTRPGIDWIFYTSALINRHAVWCEHVNADWRVCCETSIVSTRVGSVRESGDGLPISGLGSLNYRFLIDIHFDVVHVKCLFSCNCEVRTRIMYLNARRFIN